MGSADLCDLHSSFCGTMVCTLSTFVFRSILSTGQSHRTLAYLRKQTLETDSSEINSLNKDYSSSESYRWRTWLYIQSSLGFEISATDQQVVDQEHDVAITNFESIGEVLRRSCSLGTAVHLQSAMTTDENYREAPGPTR